MADKEIPALLRKDILVSPMPFAEVPTLTMGATTLPTSTPINPLSHDERVRHEFIELQREQARLKEQYGMDFAVGNAVCEACGNQFAAVAPASESVFPCPKCRTHRARWKFNFVRPGPHWACGCGCVTFRVAENGVYCPQCGQGQDLPNFVKG